MHLPDKKLHFFPSPHSFLHGLKFAAVSFGLAFGGFTHRLVDTLQILFRAVQSCLHGLSAKTSSLAFFTIIDFIFFGFIQRPVLVLQTLPFFSQLTLHCFFIELAGLLDILVSDNVNRLGA